MLGCGYPDPAFSRQEYLPALDSTDFLVLRFNSSGFFKGIEVKLSLPLVCLISTVLLGFMMFNYFSVKNRLEGDLNREAAIIIEQLAKNIINPLWNMDSSNQGKSSRGRLPINIVRNENPLDGKQKRRKKS
jgi:hypothetical protein